MASPLPTPAGLRERHGISWETCGLGAGWGRSRNGARHPSAPIPPPGEARTGDGGALRGGLGQTSQPWARPARGASASLTPIRNRAENCRGLILDRTIKVAHASEHRSSDMNPGPLKQFDPQEVLEKAMELFWAQGFEGTGMAQLVDHTGIGRQSLYNEFGDKRGLFLAALKAYCESMYALKISILEAPGSPLANIRQLGEHWLQMAEQDGCPGCLMANTLAEVDKDDVELSELLISHLGRAEDAFCGAFQRALDAGELQPDANPRDLARLFMSAGQGVSLLSRLNGSNAVVSSTIRALMSTLPAAK